MNGGRQFQAVLVQVTAWPRDRLVAVFRRDRSLGAALVISVLAGAYWGLIASDVYVSEAHVIIQRTDLPSESASGFSSLLGGIGGATSSDQLLLRDYLLSVDVLKRLDARLHLRAHYSDWHRDPLSRMWRQDEPLEWFHRYYLTRVSVELDGQAGVLVIKAQAYDSETARAIAAMLVDEGERYMNVLAHRLAEEQVSFLEKQVADLNTRAIAARQDVLKFQDQEGLVSPQETAENLAGIVNGLESRRSELQARRSAMLSYLVPGTTSIVELDQQIAAIEKQIKREKSRLAAPSGQPLNRTIEEFQRLQAAAQFADDVYKNALVALEKGRIDATRTLKKISVLQNPTLPEYPMEPRRLYNTIVFVLVASLIAGIVNLIEAVIRDHKD